MARNFKNVRTITLTAVLLALTVAGNTITKIPIALGLEIRFGFVFFSVISFLFGPIIAFAAGIIENTLSFFLSAGGFAFDIRYGLNAGLAGILYAVFLYKRNVKSKYFIIWVAAAKISVNFICNIIVNTYLLRGYLGSAAEVLTIARLYKNIGMLPIEILIMFFVLRAVSGAAAGYNFVKKRE
jgi:ECF transporter S component (folate family)